MLTEALISEMDRVEMEEFIDNMRLILRAFGHKMLKGKYQNST